VIIGEEVSSRDGHVVGLFLKQRIRPGMSAASTVQAIHDQGGLAIAAHPFWRSVRRPGRTVHGVGLLAAELDFDAIEVENSTPGLFVFNQLAHRLNNRARLPEVGGSDAHILDAVAAPPSRGARPKRCVRPWPRAGRAPSAAATGPWAWFAMPPGALPTSG
jgi:predicted metal-dependent phosphoesterase TrpH